VEGTRRKLGFSAEFNMTNFKDYCLATATTKLIFSGPVGGLNQKRLALLSILISRAAKFWA